MEERRGEAEARGTVTSGGLQLPGAGRSAPGDSCQSDQVPEDLLLHRSVHRPQTVPFESQEEDEEPWYH